MPSGDNYASARGAKAGGGKAARDHGGGGEEDDGGEGADGECAETKADVWRRVETYRLLTS